MVLFVFLIFHEHIHNGYKNLRILVWILVECTLVCKVHIGLSKSSVDILHVFIWFIFCYIYSVVGYFTKGCECNSEDNCIWSVFNFPLCVLYKVIHVTGRLRIRMALTHSRSVPNQIMGMVVVAHALPPPTINEVRIDCQMFVTRVNMDLNIIYCENR